MLQLPLVFLLATAACWHRVQPSPVFIPSENRQLVAKVRDTTLVLCYNAVSCSCAQWSVCPAESDSSHALLRTYIYLERAAPRLTDADALWTGNNLPLRVAVTGHFTTESGYPEGFTSNGKAGKEAPEPGKVFRYTQIRVLANGSH